MKQFWMALVALVPCVALAGAEVGVERWHTDHVEASQELGEWARAHRDAAHKFFEWDRKHPEKTKEFVHWTVEHPGEPLDTFAKDHNTWQVFDEIIEHHHDAADLFMVWARKHVDAAKALVSHPRGLAWVGKHIYQMD